VEPKPSSKSGLVIAGLGLVTLLIYFLVTISNRKEPDVALKGTAAVADSTTSSKPFPSVSSDSVSNMKPPKFRLLQRKPDEVLAAVVDPNTTDDQIKALLWYLHENIQAQHFKQLGIHPTSKKTGTPSYDAGFIDVYRNIQCARENWLNAGPDCGYGEHQVGEYGWGGDGGPKADFAVLIETNGARSSVFQFNEPSTKQP
jgi:hypothetical protein